MRKEFVANVSHEFRAPLTSIKGFLEIIHDQELSQAEIRESIDIMYKDTEYLEHLLSDLLTLGKLESDNTFLNKEYISPHLLISRAFKSMKNKLNNKEINLTIDLEEYLPKVYVDPNRIHQVLINILENAVNFSPEEGEIIINVELAPTRDKIIFSVSDQGPGIPEEDIDNIWQRFYKVDRARKRAKKKGSGLGLAIVKDIITKHGGEVGVESVVGKGSTFYIILDSANNITSSLFL